MTTVRVRYTVNDLDPAVEFYAKHLSFSVKQETRPNFAMRSRGNLELLLSTPFGLGGAAKPMPDGRKPEPGAGTGSSSRSMIFRRKWQGCAKHNCTSAMTWFRGLMDPKSCWILRRAIR